MRRILSLIALTVLLSLCQTVLAKKPAATPAATPAPASVAAPPSATTQPAAVAPAPVTAPKPPAPATPTPTASTPAPVKGDTAWLIVATVLVILMVLPGLALFYGGMVRAKNMLSTLMQMLAVFCMVAILWALYGYSLAFTEGSAVFGGFSKAFLSGITPDSVTGTFSKGVVVPEYIYIAFQLTFAAITPALIVGAFAERMKFSAVLLFTGLWFTFSYLPIAHMVWYWPGPDAYTDAKAAAAATAAAGFIFQKGALDFAGGTVVHVNAGIAGLVGCLVIGKRLGFGREPMAPHSVAMTMFGASLLWVGWFGFNVGSNLEANGAASLVFVNTLLATAAATLAWAAVEWLARGTPSMLGGASGAVAGLVAITPACGWSGPMGAILLGMVAGSVCFWAVTGLKNRLGYDDSLDVFGIHGIGGTIGSLGTAIVASPVLGGTGVYDYVANAVGEYSIGTQLLSQAWGVFTAMIWSGVVSFIAYKIVDLAIGLRVSEEAERQGLDIAEHGETAYNR